MNLRPKTARACLSIIGLSLVSTLSLQAQSTLHCLEKGSWLPVFEVKGGNPYCFTGDGLVKSAEEKVTMLSSSSFGNGFLEVEVLENVRSGVANSDGLLRFTAEHGWFRFSARVTAQEDIEDAYFIMRFDKLGDAEFTCKSIGDMKAGKPKLISVFRKLDFQMPEQLHFYSGMEEIRTNLVPSSYDYKFGTFSLNPVEALSEAGELVANSR